MKIMQFVHALVMGGAETLVKEYSMNFPKTEDVCVLCIERKNTPYEALLKSAGIRVIYVSDYYKPYKSKCLFGRIANYIKKNIVVRRIIRSEIPDVIHSHLELNAFIKNAKPPKSVKLIFTVHSEVDKHWNSSRGRKRDLKAAKWLVKHYNMRFIALHERMRNEINELFGVNDTVVVGNGVDFSRFENLLTKEEKRNELSIPEDASVIGHVGRFIKVKNHEFLLSVFVEYLKLNPKGYLLLVGAGELLNDIKLLANSLGISDKTLFLSNRMDVPEIMMAMDYFVMPSFYEGLPVVLIEAQKAGLKCVTSTAVTHEAVVTGGVKQISLENTPLQWAKAIDEFQYNTSFDNTIDNWDIKNVIEKLLQIYRSEI